MDINITLPYLTWKQRLDRANYRGNFVHRDRILVFNWRSCAIGEKLNIDSIVGQNISSSFILKNYGKEIFELGVKFSRAVVQNEISEAQKIYDKIQLMEVVND